MKRPCIGLAAALPILFCQSPSHAVDIPKTLMIPVISVQAESPVDDAQMTSICKGLVAPHKRGPALQGDLGLVSPAPPRLSQNLKTRYQKAQDDFFSGHHEDADRGFVEIIETAAAHPSALLPPSDLRAIVFKAHLYRAIIAHGDKENELVEKHLKTAAKHFPDLTPRSIDFPPWVRKQFNEVNAPTQTGLGNTGIGAIELDTPPGCKLTFQGRVYESGQTIDGVRKGDYALSALCAGKTTPQQRVLVTDGKVNFKPVVLGASALRVNRTDLVLEIDGTFTRDAVVRDLVSIAESAGWRRLVGVIGRAAHTEIWIVDTQTKAVIRSVQSLPKPSAEMTQTVEDLAFGRGDDRRGKDNRDTKPWYRDGLAWTLVGTGIGAFATGSMVARTHGSPSRHEELAWSLLIVGVGATGTGLTLFFIPPGKREDKESARMGSTYGIVGRVSF